jgi:hypothetical protein
LFGVSEERDVNEEASKLVDAITDQEPVNGEDLLESEELNQLREARERLRGHTISTIKLARSLAR